MTPRQMELLRFIAGYTTTHGMAPTFEEMRQALALATKSNVSRMVESLESEGYVIRRAALMKTQRRGIELTPLGRVAAGGSPLSYVATADLEAELARRAAA